MVPPVGAPREGGTALIKKIGIAIFLIVLFLLHGVAEHDAMCNYTYNEPASCR
jgi:hypothetical protein